MESAANQPDAPRPEQDVRSHLPPSAAKRRLHVFESIVGYALAFLVGFLFAGRMNDDKLRHAHLEGSAAAIYQFGLRPGLDVHLQGIVTEAAEIERRAHLLAEQHLALLPKDAPPEAAQKTQQEWQEVTARLGLIQEAGRRIEMNYCPDLAERHAAERLLAEVIAAEKKNPPHQPPATPPQGDAAPVEGKLPAQNQPNAETKSTPGKIPASDESGQENPKKP